MTTPTSHTAKHSFRTFLILWFTQSFSSFGTILALFAIDIWLVQSLFPAESQKAELGLAFAAIQLAVALPGVLGAPFAGSWADRHNRRHIMLAADLLNGALCGLLLLFLAVGQLSVPGLVVFIGLVTLVGLFHSSAFDTSYVHLVSEAQLPRANSMMQTMQTLAQLFAPGAAAALMSLPALMRQISGSNPIGQWLARLHDGFGLTIAIDLLSYWLSALILWRLVIPSPPKAAGIHTQGTFWDDVKLGFRFVQTHPAHLLLLIGVALANVIYGFLNVNIALIVKYNLGADWAARGWSFEVALAFVVTALSLAGVTAGFAISAWGGLKRNRIYGVMTGLIGYGVGCALFGFATQIYLAAAAQVLAIAALVFMNVHSQTIWQTTTPPEVQGRVFAVRTLIGRGAWPVSTAIGGLVGGRFDPGLSVGILSSVCTVFFVVLLFDRRLRQMEAAPANPAS